MPLHVSKEWRRGDLDVRVVLKGLGYAATRRELPFEQENVDDSFAVGGRMLEYKARPFARRAVGAGYGACAARAFWANGRRWESEGCIIK